MKKIFLTILLAAVSAGCRHENEPNKLIEPIPVHTSPVSVPAQMGQAWFVLKRDCLAITIPVMNRTSLTGSTYPASYPELTGPNGSHQYTFHTVERHYGTATFLIQFYDTNNAVIDPIQTQVSTATLAYVAISGSGSNAAFSFTENLQLTLDTAGLLNSTFHLAGISNFTAPNNNVTFTFAAPPGSKASFEGITDGQMNATGTGPNGATTSISLAFSIDHTANGQITWEGNSGGMHFEPNGTGFITTNTYRLLLD